MKGNHKQPSALKYNCLGGFIGVVACAILFSLTHLEMPKNVAKEVRGNNLVVDRQVIAEILRESNAKALKNQKILLNRVMEGIENLETTSALASKLEHHNDNATPKENGKGLMSSTARISDYTVFDDDATGTKGSADLWDGFEKRGYHVVPNSYYSPIMTNDDLDQHYHIRKAGRFSMEGVNMNDEGQVNFFQNGVMRFESEIVAFPEKDQHTTPPSYYWDNVMFGIMDGSLYHSIIRHYKPHRIFEVGSGMSGLVSLHATRLNDLERSNDASETRTELVVIEPYPDQGHNSHLRTTEGITVVEKKIQDVPIEFFKRLEKDDILFLDSSHVVGTGSDTTHEFLKILPVLSPGVIVHIHDIFFPNDYPEVWARKNHMFWAEQYLLHAFLLFNSEWEVVFSNSYFNAFHGDTLRKNLPDRFHRGGGSFYMRRKVL